MTKPPPKPPQQNELADIRRRSDENEIRAREVESQARLIEARLRLADAQNKWRVLAASKKLTEKSVE
jgi:hypothetical protein